MWATAKTASTALSKVGGAGFPMLSSCPASSAAGVLSSVSRRNFQTFAILEKSQSGRFTVSIKHDKPLTYEEAHKPNEIAMRKSWNSMNTSALDFEPYGKKRLGAEFGVRTSQTLNEDLFIRKFLMGTWHGLFLSEILIKRQANMIRIAGIVLRSIPQRKMYFLIGYSEELLSYWLQCPVKLELQTVEERKDVVYKYV